MVKGIFVSSNEKVLVRNYKEFEKNAHFFFAKGGFEGSFLLERWEFKFDGMEDVEQVLLTFKKYDLPEVSVGGRLFTFKGFTD